MEIVFNDQLIQIIFEIHHNYLLPVSSLLAQTVRDPDTLGQASYQLKKVNLCNCTAGN